MCILMYFEKEIDTARYYLVCEFTSVALGLTYEWSDISFASSLLLFSHRSCVESRLLEYACVFK